MEIRIAELKEALEDAVNCESTHLFRIRGQVWHQVALPIIIEELKRHWKAIAARGRSVYEAARCDKRVKC